MTVKGVFFDLDGTVANSLELELKAYRKATRTMGKHLKDKEILQYFFHIPDNIAAQNLGIKDVKKFMALVKKEKIASYGSYKPSPGVVYVLKALKKGGIKLALITSRASAGLDKALKALKIEGLFDTVVTDDDVILRKPHPDILYKACKNLGLAPFECLYVGDHIVDVQAAKNAGAQSALFHPMDYKKYYNKAQLLKAKPDYVFKKLDEVMKVAGVK